MTERLFQLLSGVEPKSVIELFSAALTPIIAVLATYIAYQQWRTNKTRLDLELYDRRLAVYKAVDAFYGEVAKFGTAKYPSVFELRYSTAEARFLFPLEIDKHLADVYAKAMRIAALREQIYQARESQACL